MGKIKYEKESETDLKTINRDFCKIWDCPRLKVNYPCIRCPVLTDLSAMAKALHIEEPLWQRSIFAKAA
ncbi:MAG: hypothetical protein GXY77_05295 [Fibrobacter sp.]|nr:hypothetical protein [Fibrobacter sp.]